MLAPPPLRASEQSSTSHPGLAYPLAGVFFGVGSVEGIS